jgi:hypothetical protein
MEESGLGKYTRSFGLSLAITSVLSALLVVVKELNEHTVLEWMKKATVHHWVTHGVLDIILFVVLGLVFAQMGGGRGVQISAKGLVNTIIATVVVSGLIIAGFYLIGD